MSTTRWIIETLCEHDHNRKHPIGGWDGPMCPGGSRIVVDPDNLPPEAIDRAVEAMKDRGRGSLLDGFAGVLANRFAAKSIVRAFLSDPEPGDQT